MPFLSKISLLCLSFLIVACGSESQKSSQHDQYLGQSIADIAVQTLDGEAMTLSELPTLYGDKPIILNIWATWCPPCVKELPSLDALAADGNYTVVALSTDKKVDTINAFLQKQPWGAHLKVLQDPAGKATFASIGARAIPITYVIDTNLTIRAIEAGERDWNSPKMRLLINRALQN